MQPLRESSTIIIGRLDVSSCAVLLLEGNLICPPYPHSRYKKGLANILQYIRYASW